MSASPATSSTRAAASANWSGHRPLSAIAAAAGGGVPQARIRRVLQDLLEPLARLHAQGQVHGAIAMSTIGLDTSGKTHLLVPPLEPAPDAEGTLRIGGYAAFEQYTDDPEHPCGPWTDVYALSAVAHTMVVGAPPPAALARCVKDTYAPLAGRELGGYDADFLRAVDQGLSMNQQARPQSMEALAAAFGVAVARPEAPEAPAAAAAAEPAPARAAGKGNHIEGGFQVPFPADQVWAFMVDLPAVAACLPGAAIQEHDGDRVKGRIAIKFGPMAAAFNGAARLERDDANRRAVLRGAGQDTLSQSRATGDIAYQVRALEGGQTRVDVDLQYTLQGPLAQFSRSGLVQDFVRRMIADFGKNVGARLGAGADGEAPAQAEFNAVGMFFSVLWMRVKRWFGRAG
ncbi:SRPBCC domain-containing protein [Bordetella petrii]|uniref:SRPBCC domain-containing protein n=1 Tax=Bordetella petrii TaxID=94624 RepID=A0ABT7W2W9_9BORD|nr:SRPBCC domain-containing protein [Bordetella petrii]MDM9559507.1 SRPBCC domain-containing protein [Bordetella petrii]